MVLATTPAVLLSQTGWMPFSNYVIELYEIGMTGAVASSCVQLLEAPSFFFCSTFEFFALLYDLAWNLVCGMN